MPGRLFILYVYVDESHVRVIFILLMCVYTDGAKGD